MSAAGKTESGKSSDNVQVAVRCRPLNPNEVQHSVVVEVDGVKGEIRLTPPTAHHRQTADNQRTFTFDSVFGFDSQQVEIYNETARPIVDSVLEGYNGT